MSVCLANTIVLGRKPRVLGVDIHRSRSRDVQCPQTRGLADVDPARAQLGLEGSEVRRRTSVFVLEGCRDSEEVARATAVVIDRSVLGDEGDLGGGDVRNEQHHQENNGTEAQRHRNAQGQHTLDHRTNKARFPSLRRFGRVPPEARQPTGTPGRPRLGFVITSQRGRQKKGALAPLSVEHPWIQGVAELGGRSGVSRRPQTPVRTRRSRPDGGRK